MDGTKGSAAPSGSLAVAPSPLSDRERADVTAYLENYRPIAAIVSPGHWEAIREFTISAAADAAPFTKYQAKAIVSPLSHFVDHWWMRGVPLEREAMLQGHHVDTFLEEGWAKLPRARRPSDPTLGNYRTMLYAVCDAVGEPRQVPRRAAPLVAANPAVPYSSKEQTAHRAMVGGQSTEYRNENLELLLALGYGGGMPTEDIAVLHGTHIVTTKAGVDIHVPGRRPRVVPVMPEWEAVLAMAAERAGDDKLFLPGRDGYKRNLLSTFISDLSHGGAPRLSTQRLRATWIVRLLNGGVNVKVIMAVAGVSDLYAIARYVQFIDDVPPAKGHAAIRALGRTGRSA